MKKNRLLVYILCITLLIVPLSGCKRKVSIGDAIKQNTQSLKEGIQNIKDIKSVLENGFSLDSYNIIKTKDNETQIDTSSYGISSISQDKSEVVFNKIFEDYGKGINSELDLSKAVFNAVFSPQTIQKKYGNTIYEDTKIDISDYMQTLVDNYDELDKSFKESLKLVLNPYNNNKNANMQETGITNLLFQQAYAEDELLAEYKLLDEDIYPNIVLKTYNIDLYEDIKEAVLDSRFSFEDLGLEHPQFEIEIKTVNLPMFTQSYSLLIPNILLDEIGDSSDGVSKYVIFINNNLYYEDLRGSIIHELFHAYQYQLGLKPHGEEAKWLRNATSMWAVDYVDAELDYEHDYVSLLYENYSLDPIVANENEYHTWYQMFLYFTKITRSYDSKYIKNLFDNFLNSISLEEAFTKTHIGRQFFNQEFIQLGIALEGSVPEGKSFYDTDEYYPDIDLIIPQDCVYDIDEKLSSIDDPWTNQKINTGFRYELIEIPEDYDEKIILMQNIEKDAEKQKTGIVAATHSNGEWKWDYFDTKLLEMVKVFDVQSNNIDAILLLMFSTDFNSLEELSYKIVANSPKKVIGNITYDITKDASNPEKGITSKVTSSIKIEETLTKYEMDLGINQSLETMATGDMYNIDDFTLRLHMINEYKNKEYSEKTVSTGTFFYNAENDSGSSESGSITDNGLFGNLPIPSLPSLPSENGSEQSLESAFKDLNELFKNGLGSSDMGMGPEIQGELPDFEEATEALQNLQNMPSILGGTIGKYKRFQIKHGQKSFEVFPSIPNNIFTDKWVSHDYEYIYKDSEGKTKRETKTYIDVYPGTEILPFWFLNPDYNPKDTAGLDQYKAMNENPSLALDSFEDTKDIQDMIIELNNRFNRLNIFSLISDPGVKRGVDVELMNSNMESGDFYENAMFNGEMFEGTLEGDFVSKKGNKYSVKIKFNYQFVD